ncbi:MAG TPA: hypothetical protein VL426_07755 [Candidatus Binatia bacterium]|jgi:hypothetical protein|nr:hypothetical protein [Candidatus Binatia bacterium]
MGLVDFILGAAAEGLPGRKRRDPTPEEMRYFAEKAQRSEEMMVDGARMLAFERQNKLCASCGTLVTEQGARLRLVTSEKGMTPDNVILVCEACEKKLEAPKR